SKRDWSSDVCSSDLPARCAVEKEAAMTLDVKQMKSLALAYMGDAVYEVRVREYLLYSGKVKPHDLHQQAVAFVSAKAQASVLLHWLDNDVLTEHEQHVAKRGRNAKSGSAPKNTNEQTYQY